MNIIQRFLNRKTLRAIDNYEKHKYQMIKRLIVERVQKFEPQHAPQLQFLDKATEEMLLASPEAIIVTIVTLYYMHERHGEAHTANLENVERNLSSTRVNPPEFGNLRGYVHVKLKAELERIGNPTSAQPWRHDA